jgi:hypothetical protein
MGKDVELLCQARGDPQPDTFWVGPDGKTITDSTKFRVRIMINLLRSFSPQAF